MLRVMPWIRLIAACCVMVAAAAFSALSPAAAAEGAGGCKQATNKACCTEGGFTEGTECGEEQSGCTTCVPSLNDVCYEGGGPHHVHWYPE
jgi:hypothetical protein